MTRLGVAAVMAVYNQRETILEAIDSIMAQTRPADEVIVVDDGSTDGSGDLVAQRYGSRLQVIHQQNRGAAAARNVGIKATRSPLLAFLDGDDRWLPNRIERQAAFMEEQSSCQLSFGAHITCNEALQESWVENNRIEKDRFLTTTFIQERALPACNTVMVRRAALEEVGLFDESLWQGEDNDLWLRIMICA